VKPPVICVDCAPLLVRSAGVKTYLYHLVRGMRDLSPETVRTFLAPRHLDQLNHDGGPMTHPAKIAALLALNRLPRLFCDAAIPRCDVFHISNLLRNPPGRPRLTTTLHDLTPWIMPDSHKPSMVRAENEFAERILRRARGIIAVSENTRQDAVRILKLPPERIRVIHLGVPPSYFSVSQESRDRVTAAYRLRLPYLLFVGTIEPRKNIDTLLTAWEGLPASLRKGNELVLVGMSGWQAKATTDRILQANREGRIRYLGYVPETDLPALTAAATGFVYPSLYEGFGIPVAQAMAAGCPVITSNMSSLPEITSGAALLIDPKSVSELGGAMQSLIESADLRARLRSLGIDVAAKYTWERAAAESLNFLSGVTRLNCV
jgi:glycosyltransferase involved in cell wall biosynthesis